MAYRTLRSAHRWVGFLTSLFLLLIALTGILLALKSKLSWVRPPSSDGTAIEQFDQLVHPGQAMEAAFAVGDERLKSHKDVDRVDYRPKDNIYKITSKDGYLEIQVDGSTGKVLTEAARTDQWLEDIHDLSFFHPELRVFILPIIGIGLLGLSISGIVLFAIPPWRRYQFKKSGGVKNSP